MIFNIIQLILSIILICVGLAAFTETVGKGIFAVGGILLINTIRMMWHGKGALSVVQFVNELPSVEDLHLPKQITLTAANPMMKDDYAVFLNNEKVGIVTHSNPFTFSTTKLKNVLHISNWHRNPCFFEISDPNGLGQLEMQMGLTTPKLVIIENTGIKPLQKI